MKKFTFLGITVNLSKKQIAKGKNLALENSSVESSVNAIREDDSYHKGKADAYKEQFEFFKEIMRNVLAEKKSLN